MSLRVYIGFDAREQAAFDVACKTARSFGCDVSPLYESRLRDAGILTRPVDRRGQMYDLNSNAAQSTDFAISRFFTPLLAHDGWALFVDADVVFMEDPHRLIDLADPSKAVMVVRHPPLNQEGVKMDDQRQQAYARKNWSSVMYFNVGHPANKRLNLTMLNQWPGKDLHFFGWLHDDEIGELPAEFNWLVNLTPKPERPVVAHFTTGGPFLPGWKGAPHDDIWLRAAG